MSIPPRSVRSVVRTAALVGLAALALIGAASATTAQTELTMVVRVLRESRDFRARARAALALGGSNDRSATPHLIQALSDENPGVRAAAATALGRIADPAALPALRAARTDRARIVREELDRAIGRIESARPSTPEPPPRPAVPLPRSAAGTVLPNIVVVPPARDIHWPQVRQVVVLGSLENRSGFTEPSLMQVLDREVMRHLLVLRGVAVLRDGQVSPAAEREIQRRRLPKLRLEGSLNRVDRQLAARDLSVRCEVALMLLDDGRNMRGVLNGAATGRDALRGPREQQERALAEQALAGAIRSAMSGAARAIASAGRR
jgi:hypothetical protein